MASDLVNLAAIRLTPLPARVRLNHGSPMDRLDRSLNKSAYYAPRPMHHDLGSPIQFVWSRVDPANTTGVFSLKKAYKRDLS